MAVERYCIPTSVDEALALLAKHGNRAAVVGGATALSLARAPRIDTLVDLLRCGLDEIALQSERVRLGATASAAAIASEPRLDALGTGLLREAASLIAPQAIRNQVTLGGNLVGVLSWSDLPVALLALDARVLTAKAKGKGRALGMETLFAAHPRKVLAHDEIITGVEIDRPPRGTGGAFVKIAQTVSDTAWVNAAAVVELDRDACRGARIAIGAVQPRPSRATAAEELLAGSEMSDSLIAEASQAAVETLTIRRDMRTSQAYRRTLLAAAIRRALAAAWQRAKGLTPYTAPRRFAPPRWPRHKPGSETGRVLAARIDGAEYRLPIRPEDLLLDVLRRYAVTSVKRGCDDGSCGACAVRVDGRLMNACLVFAAQVQGCDITTVAGIGTVFAPHPLQAAFVEEGAVQCGFCTPGMIVAAKTLLDHIPDPTDVEVREALDGNLCRCTGYVKPLEAIRVAARVMHGGGA